MNIGLQDGLLEQKHMDKLGIAMWLFSWLVRRQTRNGKVLGGKPITYQDFAKDFPNVNRRTYIRWLSLVETGGYVKLIRTPRGYIIEVSKNKKWQKPDVTKTSHQKQSDVTKMGSDVTKMSHARDVTKMSHAIKRKSLEKERDSTNVEGETPKYGKPEINKMFNFWQETVGYAVTGKRQANRNACNNLLKQHGVDKLKALVRGVAATGQDEFAPRISDFTELQSKLNKLLDWGKRKTTTRGITKV